MAARRDQAADRVGHCDAKTRGERGRRLKAASQNQDFRGPRRKQEDRRVFDPRKRRGGDAHRFGREHAGIGKRRRAGEILQEDKTEVVGKQ